MSKEVSDDDLEKRMRAALNIDNWKGNRRFSDQEFRSAEALAGRRMANALNRKTTSRPVRYRPPVRVAEYYEVPANELGFGGGWTIVLVEDGYRRDHMSGLSRQETLAEIRQLNREGYQDKKIVTERMRQEAALVTKTDRPRTSSRKAMIAKIGGFRC